MIFLNIYISINHYFKVIFIIDFKAIFIIDFKAIFIIDFKVIFIIDFIYFYFTHHLSDYRNIIINLKILD